MEMSPNPFVCYIVFMGFQWWFIDRVVNKRDTIFETFSNACSITKIVFGFKCHWSLFYSSIWQEVNIVSGSGLMHSGNKPLSYPMLTHVATTS